MILEGPSGEARLAQYFDSIGETGAAISGLRPLALGWEADVLAFTKTVGEQVQQLILRLYPSGQQTEWVTNEFRTMQAVRGAGYPVPEVFRLETDPAWFGGPFIIMERVEGVPLRERYNPADEAERRTLISVLCQLLVRLHGLDGPALLGGDRPAVSFELERHGGALREAGLAEAFAPFLDWLTQFGQAIKPEPCLIHGDFHSWNILVAEDGTPTLIDWSCAGIGDRRLELANTVILLMDQYGGLEVAQAVRRGYESLIGRELSHFAYFEALAVAQRLILMLVSMVSGSARLGLRPGLEEQLRADTRHARELCNVLRERTGLPTTAIEDVLARFD